MYNGNFCKKMAFFQIQFVKLFSCLRGKHPLSLKVVVCIHIQLWLVGIYKMKYRLFTSDKGLEQSSPSIYDSHLFRRQVKYFVIRSIDNGKTLSI